MSVKMWQTTDVDYAIAEEFFGWKWLSFLGTPMRDHPDYVTSRNGNEHIRVRQFFSPEALKSKRWKEYFVAHDAKPATGEEPLSYAYCSSAGPAMVPHYSGDFNDCRKMEDEIRRRELFETYHEMLMCQVGIEDESIHFASCEDRCLAALATIGSKYVRYPP